MAEETRSCGTCTLCCKLLAIEELNKPQGVWCTHCIKTSGCSIYDSRPESCRIFRCMWHHGGGSEDLKPERSRVVIQSIPEENRLTAYVDPNYPEAFRRPNMWRFLSQIAAGGAAVMIVIGRRAILLKNGREYKTTLEGDGLTPAAKFQIT